MFKALRIFILLFILAVIASSAWHTRTHSVEWQYTLPVNIYLINGDGSPAAAEYLHGLKAEDFKPIEKFMRDEAERYGRSAKASIEIRMGSTIAVSPPVPPSNSSPLEAIAWSLKMRWWAYRNTDTKGPGPQVKMFLLYSDPALSKRLPHSTGLQKGLIGRVNVFASRDMAKQNNVVIAHEFLHTLGASDKYDIATNQPSFPDGYANPEQVPLLPQKLAEIMAGRTPLTVNEAVTPPSLEDAVIGKKTAQEINWQ